MPRPSQASRTQEEASPVSSEAEAGDDDRTPPWKKRRCGPTQSVQRLPQVVQERRTPVVVPPRYMMNQPTAKVAIISIMILQCCSAYRSQDQQIG